LEPWDESGTPATGSLNAGVHQATPTKDKNTENMRRDVYAYDEQELEDGDLPPLNLTQNSRDRNGNRTTSQGAVALSDPELKKQQDFWKQLDAPSSLSNDDSRKRRSIGGNHAQYEDGPEDEMRDRRREAREESRKDLFRSRKTTDRSQGSGDQTEPIRIAETEDSEDSRDTKEYIVGEHEETNFCDHTLSAMEAICGEAALQSFCGGTASGTNTMPRKSRVNSNPNGEQDDARARRAKNLNVLNARKEGDSVDEHTAIEVEYVEPEDTSGVAQEKPENWSPSRKNAYLAAMARKAKEDFEKSQAKEMESMSPTKNSAGASSSASIGSVPTESASEDVYNSFNAAEKRKFLRLINSGLTPSESAQRLHSERQNMKVKENKSSKKGKLFKFWKKSSSKSKTQTSVSSGAENGSQEEKKEDDHRAMEDDQATQEIDSTLGENWTGELSRDARAQESQSQSHSDSLSHIQSRSRSQSVSEESNNDDVSQGARYEPKSPSTCVDSDVCDRPRGMAGKVAETKATNQEEVTVVQCATPESASEASLDKENEAHESAPTSDPIDAAEDFHGDLADFDGGFAKSGINYYDAVRRELSESDDETNFSNAHPASTKTRPHRMSKLGPILQSPKLKGFSKLSKREGKEAETNEAYKPTAPFVTPDVGGRINQSEDHRAYLEEETPVIETAAPESRHISPAKVDANNCEDTVERHFTSTEEEAFGKVEQELLRPIAKLTGPSLSMPPVGKPQPLVVSPESSVGSTPPPDIDISARLCNQDGASMTPAPAKDSAMDFNMQEYFNATDLYSQSAYVNDSMSVVSGRSFSTAETGLNGPGSVLTQGSALTQSSRKRRPGAAKTRLAKAKEAEKQSLKKKGWHESIRAAAETTNRVWKPKLGWVDYMDPSNDANTADLATTNPSSEKIHLKLAVGRGGKDDDSMTPETVGICSNPGPKALRNDAPFPSEWEKERSAMVQGQMPAQQPDRSNAKPLPVSLDEISVEQSVAHSVDQFVKTVGTASPSKACRKKAAASPLRAQRMINSPSKRSGWVDSMRAASAKIGKDSQSWDPTNGWANMGEVTEEPVADFSLPSERYVQETIAERQTGLAERYESGIPVNDPAPDFGPNNSRATRGRSACEDVDGDSLKIAATLPVRVGTANTHSAGVDERENKASELLEPTVPPAEPANIGFSGQAQPEEIDELALIDTAGGFTVKATVDVVKEKVDEKDMSWFPTTRRGSTNPINNVWADKHEEKEAASVSPRSIAASSKSSSRRSRGPVDVDGAEFLEDSEEEDDTDVVWENGIMFENGVSSESKLRNKNAAGTESKSGSSVSSKTSYSKSVPKLSSSKRDTSPIRAGKAVETGKGCTDTSGPPLATDNNPASGIFALKETKTIPVDEDPHCKFVMEETQAISDAQKSGRQRTPKSIAPQDSRSLSHSAGSSTVKVRAQEWEKRQPNENSLAGDLRHNSDDLGHLNAATAEWKSFLGKKVRAESAAAARNLSHEDAAQLEIMYVGEPNDSLFEFSVAGESSVGCTARNAANETADGAENHVGDTQYSSSSEVQATDGSDYSDGNEINKSFFTRLAGCAAPMMPKRVQNGDAMAHLPFLRTSARHLCGRPDVIVEEVEEGDESRQEEGEEKSSNKQTMSLTNQQLRDIKSRSEVRPDTRTVISEDFGAKTAYLEALAMKTAVAKPRRSDSRRKERSSASYDISSNTSKSHQKEKWRDFIKSRPGTSPGKARGNGSDASAAAESYAQKKVEEMMAAMASRSKSTPRSWRSHPVEQSDAGHNSRSCNFHDYTSQHVADQENSNFKIGGNAESTENFKTDSVAAAEALASARVNAMMQALAASTKASAVEEGEI